jgi:UDP-2,3-diacylglucosamine pyrophosphatase LpxH
VTLAVTGCASASAAGPQDAHGGTAFFISDLHMGIGDRLSGKYANQEDFRWHEDLSAWLDYADRSTASNADLVILGDAFELWQSPFQICEGDGVTFKCEAKDCRPEDNGAGFGCTEEEAVQRVDHVLRQHQKTIDALSAFARKGENRLTIVPGNHDAALLLPKVRTAVLEAFHDPDESRVSLSETGYWVSADKKIYADHGHMYDRVNRFDGWPHPFEVRAAGPVMRQPWGEDMVQHFYNQYEELLPIIDNVGTEIAGARLGVDALGNAVARTAARRFIKFLVLDTTLSQKLSFLGESSADDGNLTLGGAPAAGAPWDFAAIRAQDAGKFYAGSMPLDALREAAQNAGVQTSWEDVLDDDIAVLCEQRKVLIEYYQKAEARPEGTITPCPVKEPSPRLGYVADKILGRDARNRRVYLQAMRTTVRKPFDVYVYGHTHTAVAPFPQKIKALWTVRVVNDGAFQRTISLEQLDALARMEDTTTATLFAELTPDDLQPCYPFVRVHPYAANQKPTPELKWWSLADGKWSEEDSCAAWP